MHVQVYTNAEGCKLKCRSTSLSWNLLGGNKTGQFVLLYVHFSEDTFQLRILKSNMNYCIWESYWIYIAFIHNILSHQCNYFLRENVFKIIPVQVPTKLKMWQNYVAFVFVITYVLQAMWPCVVHILIIDHRPLLSMRVPRVCALTSWAGSGASGVSIRAPAEQRISRSSVTERDRRVIVIRTCRACWAQ
jgi:hypothetical protein